MLKIIVAMNVFFFLDFNTLAYYFEKHLYIVLKYMFYLLNCVIQVYFNLIRKIFFITVQNVTRIFIIDT